MLDQGHDWTLKTDEARVSPRGFSRRAALLGALAVTLTAPRLVRAAEVEAHGLSIFGHLKYPPAFRHFDYVNPDAPRGGSFSHQIAGVEGNQNLATFNTLNVYVLKGDGAAGMPLTFASLRIRDLDEPDAVYGYSASAVRVSEEGLTYRFM